MEKLSICWHQTPASGFRLFGERGWIFADVKELLKPKDFQTYSNLTKATVLLPKWRKFLTILYSKKHFLFLLPKIIMKKGSSCTNWSFIYTLMPAVLGGHFVAYIIPAPTQSILQAGAQKTAENLQWKWQRTSSATYVQSLALWPSPGVSLAVSDGRKHLQDCLPSRC